MSILQAVKRGRQATPLKWLVYSTPKAGKTHLLTGARDPIFLDCERGTLGFDCARVEITSWAQFRDAVEELLRAEHPFRTVVVDTLDALERLVIAHVIEHDHRAQSIEEVGGGYGKGWGTITAQWQWLCQQFDRLNRRGLNVVLLAHSKVERVKDPDSGEEYDRWTLLANKRTAGVFRGWVDDVLFLTRQVTTRGKRSTKGEGGARVIHTRWAPGRDAGNRRGLRDTIAIPEGDPARAWSAVHEAILEALPRPEPAPPPPAEEPADEEAE